MPQSWRIQRFLAVALVASAALASAQPSGLSLGTQITLSGAGFRPGRAPPKVVMTNPTTTRPIAMRLVSATDVEIVALVTKGGAGQYDVVVTPAGQDAAAQTFPGRFEIVGPRIDAVTPARVQAGAELTIAGEFFGRRRGKVTVGGRPAVVTSWTDTGLRVLVSKRTPAGADDVVVTNSVGSATKSGAVSLTSGSGPYTVTDLGVCAGGIGAVATGIDAAGRVIGYCTGEAGNVRHGFVYANGRMRILGSIGADSTSPRAISSAGVVVGQSFYAPGEWHGFSEDGGIHDLGGGDLSDAYGVNLAGTVVGQNASGGALHAWIFAGPGGGQDLGTLGGSASIALAVNDAGLVMGRSQVPGDVYEHAFLWNGAGLVDLGTLGGRYTTPVAMNQAGQVCGTSETYGREPHAFLYSGGTIHDIGLGTDSSAFALNASGRATGHFEAAPGGPTHAFTAGVLWWDDLGSLGGTHSAGRAINASGTVVGESTLAAGGETHAFVNIGFVMTDLNAYLPPALARTWTLVEANFINDQGSIAADGVNEAGVHHAFLLTANP